MTESEIVKKLTKGDPVTFKNGSKLYFQNYSNGKYWFKEKEGMSNTPRELKNIVKINGKELNENKMNLKQLLKEEIDNIINSQKQETLTFESDPLEYIIQKYPSLDATLTDLLTDTYRDYLTGIYNMAPKPTTFKILLHNGQSFYLIYAPKAYLCKVSGKQYNLMGLKEEELAIKAISKLLLMGIPPGSTGPGEEQENNADPKSEFASDMTSEPVDGEETDSEENSDEEPEEELQEQPKKITKFRIKR